MSSSSSDSSSEAEDEAHVESLVAGRERRTNAGNRMATLLATEEPVEAQGDEDDDLKLLFEENAEEEDAEFASADDAMSDVEMGSSSDEDEGKEEDEDAGEKELQRQAKEEKKRKRKALETFGTNKKRKLVGFKSSSAIKTSGATAETSTHTKKRVERVTWLPVQDDRSTRASSRKQTVLNKQIVHERMKESEKKRRELLSAMEAAAKRKEAEKSEALTQEDRLAEAARTEARNSKTLNRWEAAEQRRVEDQRAKLAALKSRGIEGPVIRTWSGPSKWIDGKCVGIGKKVLEVSSKEQKIQEKNTSPTLVSRPKPGTTAISDSIQANSTTSLPAITLSAPEMLQDHKGIWIGSAPDNPFHVGPEVSELPTSTTATPTIPSENQVVEIQSKTLILIDEEALVEPSVRNSMLVKSRRSAIKINGKLPEKDKCLITGMHAIYRDPETGVSYANVAGFKQLRANESLGTYVNGRWSTLLGQYVGSDMEAPLALPERLRKGVGT